MKEIMVLVMVMIVLTAKAFKQAPSSPQEIWKSSQLRPFLQTILIGTTTVLPLLVMHPLKSRADSVSDAVSFVSKVQQDRPLLSDEFELSFPDDSLGLSLRENLYNGFPVVTVQSSVKLLPSLRQGAILTRVNGEAVDGLPLKDIIRAIQQSSRPVVIRFRDPSR